MQSGAGNGANQIAAVLHSNIFTRDYVDVGSCRVALKSALPQSVWRNGSILARNNSGPARPYMARLRVFRRLI